MHSTRRSILAGLGAGGLAVAGVARPVAAQSARPEGSAFRPVQPPVPTEAPAGKVEVIEFFWYGCPHCNALEPAVKAWARQLPPDVAFRKVHVPWQVQAHQQLFYTLDALGKADELGDRVFAAIHTDRQRLDTPEAMADLLARHGVDRKQFLDAYSSFGVRAKVQRATQLAAAYKVDGVPMFGVAGRWVTAPSMAGSNAEALKVVDALVDRARKGG
jgi:thiol:disulfide interchange protein DsbA